MRAIADESLDDEIVRRAASFERKQHLRAVEADESHQIGDIQSAFVDDGRRYKVGLDNLDRGIPMRPRGFMVVAAVTGYGKTSFLEQCARANAVDHSVYFATLEMEEDEIQDNMLAREMNCTLDDFERLRKANSPEYRAALDRVRSLNLRLFRPPMGRTGNIRTIFKQAVKRSSEMLLIDYTKLLDGWVPGNDANKMVDYIAEETKASGLYTILLAQLDFDAIGKRPTLRNIQDAKRLPQASTTTVLIHRPFAGNKKRDVIAELIVAKNRKGPLFRGHTYWENTLRTYYSMNQEEELRCECCRPRKKPAASATKRSASEIDEEDALLDESTIPFGTP